MMRHFEERKELNYHVHPCKIQKYQWYLYHYSQSLINIPQNFAPIISDMATNDMVYKPNLIYVPSAEYRFIDMAYL